MSRNVHTGLSLSRWDNSTGSHIFHTKTFPHLNINICQEDFFQDPTNSSNVNIETHCMDNMYCV